MREEIGKGHQMESREGERQEQEKIKISSLMEA